MNETRNLYTALLFAERPDLHLTLRYYPKVAPRGPWECDLVQKVGAFWSQKKPQPFVLELTERAMFGPRRNIPVLLATGLPLLIPSWVSELRDVKLPDKPDTYPFRPHVTTDADAPLRLLVSDIAIMHKDKAIWRYEL